MYEKFQDIPQFPFASYRVNISWMFLQDWIKSNQESTIYKFTMDPEYQRGYIWTKNQKEKYVEYRLRGGFSGKDIFWNCANWMSRREHRDTDVLELVDGKQRVDAVLGFLNNKIKAFGKYRNEFKDQLHYTQHDFVFHINNLETRKEVVEWYLGLNTGGSVHTPKDLKPALTLLKKLENKDGL